MSDEKLLEALAILGLDVQEQASPWRSAVPLLVALDAIGRDGGVVVIKVDGERERSVYTVVVSGGRLGHTVFRKDGPDLPRLLLAAIRFWIDRVEAR